MEIDNEKNQEQLNEEQKNPTSHEGKPFRPVGRSPRPRINTTTRPVGGSYNRPSFNRFNNEEEGFRPEGFGASLQSTPSQRPYRPRTSYNNGGGYSQPRPQQGGYQPRPQQSGYQPRPRFNQEGEVQQSGYQPRARFTQSGEGYRPRYNQEGEGQQGGYQPRPRYNQPRQQGGQGGYGQPRQQYGAPRPYNNARGGYNARGNSYDQQRPRRPHTADYDPNAKYSMKKRIEYKEQNFDPNEPIRLNKYLAKAGVCSRREADEFIQAGVVTVNGQVVTELGTKVMRTDEVRFHNDPVSLE